MGEDPLGSEHPYGPGAGVILEAGVLAFDGRALLVTLLFRRRYLAFWFDAAAKLLWAWVGFWAE